VYTANYPKRVTLGIPECVSESRTHNTFIRGNEVKHCLPGYCLRIVQKMWRFFWLYRQKTTVNKTTAIFFFCPSFRLLYLFAFVFAIASVHSLSSRLVSLRLVLSRLFRLVLSRLFRLVLSRLFRFVLSRLFRFVLSRLWRFFLSRLFRFVLSSFRFYHVLSWLSWCRLYLFSSLVFAFLSKWLPCLCL
jgi:hypothetical protein